jgi:DNA-binding NtrC family response regulator
MNNLEKIRVLVLDDEKDFTEELCEYLTHLGMDAVEANTASEGMKVLSRSGFDLLVLDVRLGAVNGLDVLKEVKKMYPGMEVIVVSAHGDMDTVINAMRLGAFDYLRKPFRHIDIQIAIERTRKFLWVQRKLRQAEEKNSLISKSLEEKIDRQFIGVSSQIQEVFDAAMTAASYPDSNVLITGESGTGKENIARIIHYSSTRKDHVFCAVNSSAITETLLESEFFGHKKGSFTGAIEDKMGFFEVCNNGTLFLDEIADMPLTLQAKILRASEEKIITRVGDTKQIPTNFRIISATNHDIEQKVARKEFRLDLFHRLNTLHIHIPPLRQHRDDIRPLLLYYVERFSVQFNKPRVQIDERVFDVLMSYDFPGNVRELRNMAERAIILCKADVLSPADFPVRAGLQTADPTPEASRRPAPNPPTTEPESSDLKSHERALIRSALKQCSYNQTAAAELLGITRDTLIRKMKKHQICITRKDDSES